MLHFQIDPGSGVPVYRQLMDQVRYYAAAGRLKPGDRLPSIREMAVTLHVNPTTIVKAYSELAHGGDIRMEHGKGVFVSEATGTKSRAEMEREFRRLSSPLAAAALQMGLPSGRASELLRDEIDKLAKGGRA